MVRFALRSVVGGVFMGVALGLTGCGDSGGGNPKTINSDGKSLPVQTPPGVGGAPVPKAPPKAGAQ